MEINAGGRTGQASRGVDRTLEAVAGAIPQRSARPRHSARVPARWLIERGETLAEARVIALGGFPGALRSMNRLDDVRLVVSSRYLVVGEGTSHGFAIPMRDVLAATVMRPDHRSNDGIVIWYRDEGRFSSFFLGFPGLSRGINGVRRAEAVMQVLAERGVDPVDASEVERQPSLHLSWDEAERFGAEPLVWSGDGIASVGGWYGSRRDTCRLWLTDSSLLWAGASQDGVNRIALADILEARDGAGDRVSISIRDEMGYRYDLAFDLAIDHVELQRQANPRVQLMDALARRGVPVSTVAVPLAPWRSGRLIRPMDRQELPDLSW